MRHECRVMRPPFSFPRKKTGVARPKERRFPLQASSSKSCNACRLLLPARALPRLALLYDLTCSYHPLLRSFGGSAALRMRHTPCGCRSAHLVEVQTNLLLPTMHTVSIMRTAASEAMPLRQAIPGLIESEVERSYVRVINRRQSDSEDRSKSNRLDIKQGRHLIRQALQFFELLACNGGVKGQGPLRSLGGPRGIFSHVRDYPPFPVQRLRRCFPPPRNTRKNIKKSTLAGALFKSLRISRTGTSGRLRR